MALGRGLGAAGEHRDRDAAGRDGRGQGAVDGAGLGIRGAREIDAHRGSVDLDGYLEGYRIGLDAVVVQPSLGDVAAVRDRGEVIAHDALAAVVHALDQARKGLETVALDHPHQARGAGPHAGDLSVDVAGHHLGQPRVGEHHAVDVIDELAAAVELDARINGPFLEDIDGVGRKGLFAADVEPVPLDRGVAHQRRVAEEYGHHQRRVLGMRAGHIRVGDQQDVTRFHGLLAAGGLDRGAHAEVHRPHEQRQTGRLGQEPQFAVVDRDREVQDFVNDRRERGAHQRPLHLVGRRVERVAYDFGRHRIDVGRSPGRARDRPVNRDIRRVQIAAAGYSAAGRTPASSKACA